MIQSQKNDTPKMQQKNQPAQSTTDKIMQNLNKSTLSSHNHTKSPLSEPSQKSQLGLSNAQKNTNLISAQNSSAFRIQSAQKQFQQMKAEDNQFMNEQQINQRILLNGYFSAIGKQIVRKNTQFIAKKYSFKIQEHVSSNINHGIVRISKHQEDIKNLLEQFKLSAEELKLLEKRTQIQTKQHKIMLLDPFNQIRKQRLTSRQEQKSSLQKAILNNYVTSAVLSKEQHKKLVQKFNLSNKKHQLRKKQRLFQIQQRERSLSHQKSLAQAQKIKKEKQFKKLSIEQKLLRRKKNHESFVLQQKISTQRYMEMKKQKFLYEHMEQKYKSEVLIPSLEEKKIKLKEIRDLHKKYDIEQLKRHEQQYLQKKSLSNSKNNSRQKITSFHYNPPERSKRLEELLQEQRYRSKIKFEQKKRVAEQNKIKQINFLSDIKIKYKPKIDQAKRQEIQKRLKSEQAKNDKSVERDLKLLGMKHFEESKKFIKRTKNKQKTQVQDMKKPEHKSQRQSTNFKQKTQGNDILDKEDEQNEFLKIKISRKSSRTRPQKRINVSFSQNSNHKINLQDEKRKELKKIINSKDLEWGVKFERLKIENQRISEVYKRKEHFFRDHEDDEKSREQAVGLLLNSIQAKMGLIDLCTKS